MLYKKHSQKHKKSNDRANAVTHKPDSAMKSSLLEDIYLFIGLVSINPNKFINIFFLFLITKNPLMI